MGKDWSPKVDGYDWNDPENEYAGDGKVIDAVRVYYNTPDDIVRKQGYQESTVQIQPD